MPLTTSPIFLMHEETGVEGSHDTLTMHVLDCYLVYI